MSQAALSFTGDSTARIALGDVIAHHAADNPSAPLLIFEDRTVSRAEFDALSNRRARLLAERGVKHDDLVTIALPNGSEFYETVFAVWKLGATPNPVSAKLPDGELRGIIEVGKPRLVVGGPASGTSDFPRLESTPVVPDRFSADPLDSPTATYFKAMTSGGSTGRPKMIVDHMAGDWDPDAGGLSQRAGETVLNAGPLYHNGPFLATMIAMFTGGRVVERIRFDPVDFLRQIERERVTWALLVPTMMHRIARLPEEERLSFDVSSLHRILHTAAPCPAWLKRLWIDWLGPEKMLEIYTGTERQAVFTISGQEALDHPGSVGRLQPGASLRVLDKEGNEVAPGEIGELFFLPEGGRNSTYHYLGADARASGEWESLGDMGRIDADGYVYLSDRRADMIIRGGANIYPAEIEAAIDRHPAVGSSIVVGLPHEDLGQSVHAIVQVAHDCALGENELTEFLRSAISNYKIPSSFEFVDKPLRDDAGKARRSQLRQDRADTIEAAAQEQQGTR